MVGALWSGVVGCEVEYVSGFVLGVSLGKGEGGREGRAGHVCCSVCAGVGFWSLCAVCGC